MKDEKALALAVRWYAELEAEGRETDVQCLSNIVGELLEALVGKEAMEAAKNEAKDRR